MRVTMNGVLRSLILGGTVFGLAACGGGGGGGGGNGVDPVNEYKITLTAAKTALPLNLYYDVLPPAYFPSSASSYATTLYVDARREGTNDPIPGGDEVFGCNIVSGLDSGALYYFDGDETHRVDVVGSDGETYSIEGAYRSITLGANSGGASFHVLSTDIVGTVRVRCTVTDPQSNTQKSTEIDIKVGGSSSGKPSQVLLSQETTSWGPAGILGTPGVGLPTQMIVNVNVVDEAGQRVNASGTPNLLARIVPSTPAGTTAMLRSGNVTGRSVTTSSINGEARFTVIAGSQPGNFIVEFYADRADNNVMNGLGEAVYNAAGFYVFNYIPPSTPLAITSTTVPDAYLGTPYATMLVASGGLTPYQWALAPASVLPDGLTLSADGVLSGTPEVVGDNMSFIVELYDKTGAKVTQVFVINVKAEGGMPQLEITTATLPSATVGVAYAAILEVSGGKAPYTWSKVSGDAQLSVSPDGIVSGTVAVAGPYPITVKATDANGKTAQKSFILTVATP